MALRILWVVVVLVLLYGVLLALAWWRQDALIYFPAGSVPPVATALPDAEAVRVPVSAGTTLGAWLSPAVGTARGTVVVFNGNAGNRAHRAPLALALNRRGWNAVLFDYRGYGDSPGQPTEAGLLADAQALRRYLEGRADLDPSRLVYLGESLGAAVALAAALVDPPAALVLRSPFTSLLDVARHHYPYLPAGRLLRDRYPSLERIGSLDCPLLVVAGGRDRIVPPEHSHTLFSAAPGAFKRWRLLPQADHNDPQFLGGERFLDPVTKFLEDVLEPVVVPGGAR